MLIVRIGGAGEKNPGGGDREEVARRWRGGGEEVTESTPNRS